MAATYEVGDFDSLDDKLYQKKIIRFKNSYLVPIYSRIKGLIAFLNNDEEKQILAEYKVSKKLIKSNSK